jgi:hypothetical protein
MTTDRCTDTQPHLAHRTQYGPFGVKDCPGVPVPRPVPSTADRMRHATGPLRLDPDNPNAYVDADGMRAVNADTVTALCERDQAREQLDIATTTADEMTRAVKRLVGERDQARATVIRREERIAQLVAENRRNGTLICLLRDLDEQRDRAWAAHDTVGEPDRPPFLKTWHEPPPAQRCPSRIAHESGVVLGCRRPAGHEIGDHIAGDPRVRRTDDDDRALTPPAPTTPTRDEQP